MGHTPTAISTEAWQVGRDLALDFFDVWRGHRDAVDALVLLAITRSNVDGIVYSAELRSRFGGAKPVAPDHLRQEVSIDVLAQSLRLPAPMARRRVEALAANDQCVITPFGMLITEQQVEASNRLHVIREVYSLLKLAFERLDRAGLFDGISLPPPEPAHPQPVRSAAAHGAKYVLRLLGGIAVHLGDHVDALVALHLLRSAGRSRSPSETAAELGLPPGVVARRIGRLLSERFCERIRPGRIICQADAAWLAKAEETNLKYVLQLFAGLAEVGALSDFARPG